MAKGTATKGAKTVATVVTPGEMVELQQVFKASEKTSEEDIMRADGFPGVRIEFDYVHFRKLPDDFVAGLKPHNQKAYWLAFAEFEDRLRRSNIALHEIGVDPMTKILDRPRGKNNPLVRDGEKIQALLKGYYVTWRIQGGEGDYIGALESGFKVIRKPLNVEEEKTKSPLEWSGEVWKIRDGTVDPTSGEEIFNVMMCIEKQRWDDHLKAVSMASHNAYAQNKKLFYEGAENISRDMLGGKEKVIAPEWDLDQTREEEFIPGKRK